MTDVAQIQPEHFVPVTNRKEKRMKIERKYKNLIRKPLVWHKFSFHEWGYITLYALHSYLHSCYVRVVRGRVPLCLRRFAPWWNATEFLRASKKGWRNILPPQLTDPSPRLTPSPRTPNFLSFVSVPSLAFY